MLLMVVVVSVVVGGDCHKQILPPLNGALHFFALNGTLHIVLVGVRRGVWRNDQRVVLALADCPCCCRYHLIACMILLWSIWASHHY
jgi:hypothetical protein